MKIFFFAFLFSFQISFGQYWGDSTLKSKMIFTSVEESPKFPGGNKGFYQFIAKNLKQPRQSYSTFSNKLIVVKTIIDKEGNIVFAEVEKGTNLEYNQAVLELIKKMPIWNPGKQNGKNVFCYQTISIVFVE